MISPVGLKLICIELLFLFKRVVFEVTHKSTAPIARVQPIVYRAKVVIYSDTCDHFSSIDEREGGRREGEGEGRGGGREVR